MNMRTPHSLVYEDESEVLPAVTNQEVDFSEYMWMVEELEEFDQQVEEEWREQELIEQGFEDLYEMEEIASEILSSSPVEHALVTFDSSQGNMRTNGMVYARQEILSSAAGVETRTSSKLNPLAPEFIPKEQW
ncbi:polyadenylate-binding protein-interacting protein 2b [Plakobranchus ocellatus]|uniref:Polyadenylate-binding protein-interacting protein 2b n=1 Tax=Plakobranchus ocellatus TaxID=259542 RepID=A0AAV3Z4I1_9GAST|nr:polyadenylate-binding protein-interacting protein 2b [Plakobranchus ocellatus]